VGKAK